MRLQPRATGKPSSQGVCVKFQDSKGFNHQSNHHNHHDDHPHNHNDDDNHNDHQLDIGGNRAARDLSTELIDAARTAVRWHKHCDSDSDYVYSDYDLF